MLKKGLVIAATVASAMLLAGCASQGGTASACGEPTAVPACAPAPVNTCKNMSSCKHKMAHHRHHRHHHHHMMAKKAVSNTSTTTTTTSTGTTGSN